MLKTAESVHQMIVIPRVLRELVVRSATENQRSISAEFRYAMLKHLRAQERETR